MTGSFFCLILPAPVSEAQVLTQQQLPCRLSGGGNTDAPSGKSKKSKKITFFQAEDNNLKKTHNMSIVFVFSFRTFSLSKYRQNSHRGKTQRGRNLYLMGSLVALSLTVEENEE